MSIDTASLKQADVRTVAAQLGLEEPRGSLIRCPTPGHDDSTPSCQLFADGWRCHGCGARGDGIDLVRLVCGLDFRAAAAELARMLAIRIDDTAPRCRPAPRRPAGPKPLPEPSALRLEVMARIWSLVGPQADLPPRACRWLQEVRGIHPRAAWAIGCRGFERAQADLMRLWRELSHEERVDCGLADRRGGPWRGLRRPDLGLLVPCWRPGDPAPVAWRLRFFEPPRPSWKVDAQPGSAVWPAIGFEVDPDGQPAPRVADCSVVIVTEGEPDLLAVVDVLEVLGRRDVAAVGLPAISTGWWPEWTRALRHCDRVIVACHANKGPAIVRGLAAELGADKVRHALPPETGDLNDLHRGGLLAALLEGWL